MSHDGPPRVASPETPPRSTQPKQQCSSQCRTLGGPLTGQSGSAAEKDGPLSVIARATQTLTHLPRPTCSSIMTRSHSLTRLDASQNLPLALSVEKGFKRASRLGYSISFALPPVRDASLRHCTTFLQCKKLGEGQGRRPTTTWACYVTVRLKAMSNLYAWWVQ